MDLIDSLRELAAKIPTLREKKIITTEEGTKHALVMPFISALGYNVFDPLEVRPELDADIGVKKGEKVDYAIMRDNEPIMLVECKMLGADFYSGKRKANEYATQLYRYFSVKSCRFGILTDGVKYYFLTDLVEPNKLDQDPFFVFDLESFKPYDVDQLKQFTKSTFDVQQILSAVVELKYKNLFKAFITAQFEGEPDDDFVRLCLQETHAAAGRLTQQVVNEFKGRVKDALTLVINEQVDKRLQLALGAAPSPAPAAPPSDPEVTESPAAAQAIITTQDELDAYYIIKSILREVVDVKRITMRDAQTYCSILMDDNNRRPICRLRFNTNQKFMGIVTPTKEETKVPVQSLDDIYTHAEALKTIATHYAGSKAEVVQQ